MKITAAAKPARSRRPMLALLLTLTATCASWPPPLHLIPVSVGEAAADRQTGAVRTTLTVDGATVDIVRDDFGVPHIFASHPRALYSGSGYAAAQDRLAQMEKLRRPTGGELAELLGPPALAADKETRRLGYSEEERELQFRSLPESVREAVHTATLVAGPQLGFTTPSIAREVRLSGAGMNVAGISLGGVPGVTIGHNDAIAWTITSGLGDVEDVWGTYIQIAEFPAAGARAVSVLAPGQSENPTSPRFGDQREAAGFWLFKKFSPRRAELPPGTAALTSGTDPSAPRAASRHVR